MIFPSGLSFGGQALVQWLEVNSCALMKEWRHKAKPNQVNLSQGSEFMCLDLGGLESSLPWSKGWEDIRVRCVGLSWAHPTSWIILVIGLDWGLSRLVSNYESWKIGFRVGDEVLELQKEVKNRFSFSHRSSQLCSLLSLERPYLHYGQIVQAHHDTCISGGHSWLKALPHDKTQIKVCD